MCKPKRAQMKIVVVVSVAVWTCIIELATFLCCPLQNSNMEPIA